MEWGFWLWRAPRGWIILLQAECRNGIKCKPGGRPEAANFGFLGWDLLTSCTKQRHLISLHEYSSSLAHLAPRYNLFNTHTSTHEHLHRMHSWFILQWVDCRAPLLELWIPRFLRPQGKGRTGISEPQPEGTAAVRSLNKHHGHDQKLSRDPQLCPGSSATTLASWLSLASALQFPVLGDAGLGRAWGHQLVDSLETAPTQGLGAVHALTFSRGRATDFLSSRAS